jgi:hypothetical protein
VTLSYQYKRYCPEQALAVTANYWFLSENTAHYRKLNHRCTFGFDVTDNERHIGVHEILFLCQEETYLDRCLKRLTQSRYRGWSAGISGVARFPLRPGHIIVMFAPNRSYELNKKKKTQYFTEFSFVLFNNLKI